MGPRNSLLLYLVGLPLRSLERGGECRWSDVTLCMGLLVAAVTSDQTAPSGVSSNRIITLKLAESLMDLEFPTESALLQIIDLNNKSTRYK